MDECTLLMLYFMMTQWLQHVLRWKALLSKLPLKTATQNWLSGSQQCQFHLEQQPPLDIELFLPLDFRLSILLVIVALLSVWVIHICYNWAMGAKDAVHTETTMNGLFNLSWQGSLNVPSILIRICVGIAIHIIVEGCGGGCSRMMTFCCWKWANQGARLSERQPPQQQPDEISG